MLPTPGAAKEGTRGKKMGISVATGIVNKTCVFIGSDLDGPIGSDLDGSFPNGLVLGFHGGDAGNSTSISSG